MINRRSLVLACGSLLAPLVVPAHPTGKVYRVGWLGCAAYNTPEDERLVAAFVERLRELGFVEGRNLDIEWRHAEGKLERYTDFAAEMVKLKTDVVISLSSTAVRALMAASSSLPIVSAAMVDPVRSGFVASLARPGGQLTGMVNFPYELVPKQLELIKAALPGSRRIALARCNRCTLTTLGSVDAVSARNGETEEAARSLGVKLLPLEVEAPEDFGPAAAALRRERPDALLIEATPTNAALQREWLALAAELRLPMCTSRRGQGAMLSYGVDWGANFRKVAEYVAKILNGAYPGDLPIEQPMKFELVIDLKIAKAFGITIPQALLLRADEVVQ
jgi:putative ABC transport system substrate-binding protein